MVEHFDCLVHLSAPLSQLLYSLNKATNGYLVIAAFIGLDVIPEAVHVRSKESAARESLQQRVHVACVGQVGQTDSKSVLLERPIGSDPLATNGLR